MRTRFAARVGLFAGIALALSACGSKAKAPAASLAATVTPAAASAPIPQGRYLTATGAVDYDALRRVYGAPNTNLVLNPRATDVAKTASHDTVEIKPDALVFNASDARWLADKNVGDTLYCGPGCSPGPFLRNIVRIDRVGDQVIVQTAHGAITDVVVSGWIHSETPLVVGENGDDTGWLRSGAASGDEKTSDLGDKESSFSHDFSGNITGSLGPKLGFKTSLVTDFAITPKYSHLGWSGFHPTYSCTRAAPGSSFVTVKLCGASIDLIKFVLTGTTTITVGPQVKAKGAASVEYELPGVTYDFGVIVAGPVEITPELTMKPTLYAESDGKMEVHGTLSWAKSLSAGFTYSDDNGFGSVFKSPAAKVSESIGASGEASIEAGIKIPVRLALKLYDVAGPDFTLTPKAGAKAKAEVDVEDTDGMKKCEAKVTAAFFAALDGAVGVELDLRIPDTSITLVHKEANFPFSIAEQTFPDPEWSHVWKITQPSALCPPETDGGMETSSSSGSTGAETTSGSTTGGTGSGSTSGGSSGSTSGTSGSTAGSYSPCGEDSDCSNGEVCCDNQCVNEDGDPNNCGGCGMTCESFTSDPTSVCQMGQCTCTCPAGTDRAGETCGPLGTSDISTCAS